MLSSSALRADVIFEPVLAARVLASLPTPFVVEALAGRIATVFTIIFAIHEGVVGHRVERPLVARWHAAARILAFVTSPSGSLVSARKPLLDGDWGKSCYRLARPAAYTTILLVGRFV